MKVLIIGGTAEARALAGELVKRGDDVTSSLAGRVTNPRLPVGKVRIGGFGGVHGLAKYLAENGVDCVVDATHPFATTMTSHTYQAHQATGVPMVRFARPGWSGHSLAHTWHWADDVSSARQRAEYLLDERSCPKVPLITTGRQTLTHYLKWVNRPVIVRVVEPMTTPSDQWTVITDRGPYTVDSELALMTKYPIGVLLTKDSGGMYTEAKLIAAHRLGIDVVIVNRPPTPQELPFVTDIVDVLRWVSELS